MPLDVPRLTTARLILRSFEERDLDSYAEMMADPDVTRWLGAGQPMPRDEAWRQIAFILGHWVLRGFGLWAVEERDSGTLVGRIGCLQPEGWPGFEVAYTLARPFWGRGYAREGAEASLSFARETLRRDEIISIIRPANVRSIRVAESLGAMHERDIEFFGDLSRIYRYPKR
jgi:RimJ/RimL family protein N-acetyltransferase